MTVPNEIEPGKLVTDYLWVLQKAPVAHHRHLPRDRHHGGDLDLSRGADLLGDGDGADRSRAAQGAQYPGSGPDGDLGLGPQLLPDPVRDHQEQARPHPHHRDAESEGAAPRGGQRPGAASRRPARRSAVEPKRNTRLIQIRYEHPRSRHRRRGRQCRRRRVRAVQSGPQAQGRARRARLADVGGGLASRRRSRTPPRRSRTTGSRRGSWARRSSGRSPPRRSWTSTRPISRRRRSA